MNKISIKEQKMISQTEFPLVLSPDSENITFKETLDYVSKNLESILTDLKIHGAILFRGFPINDAKDFNDFCLAFGWKDLPYIGLF